MNPSCEDRQREKVSAEESDVQDDNALKYAAQPRPPVRAFEREPDAATGDHSQQRVGKPPAQRASCGAGLRGVARALDASEDAFDDRLAGHGRSTDAVDARFARIEVEQFVPRSAFPGAEKRAVLSDVADMFARVLTVSDFDGDDLQRGVEDD